jgi:hypothetical protein
LGAGNAGAHGMDPSSFNGDFIDGGSTLVWETIGRLKFTRNKSEEASDHNAHFRCRV